MVEHDPAQLLHLLAQQSTEHAFILLDVDGRVTWWSPGAEKIFNRRSSDMVGQPLSSLFTPEDLQNGIPEQELEMARTAGNAEDDRWQMRPDGSRFWATGLMVPLRDDTGNCIGFAKVVRNRTDLREQLEALRNQVEALMSANQQKSTFLATFTHELRNPLAPLSNAAQLLRLCAPADADLEYSIDVIERQVNFIRRLVDDLLEVTRITTGKLRLNKRIVSLHKIIENAVDATRPLVTERHQNLQTILPSGPIDLEADPDRLHQVVVNLITNAAKYTPEHGHIWVKGTTEGDEAVIIVEDTGRGIPYEMLSRIFDLFTQVENPAAPGGLGIGLALVKDLINAHGGTVQVRSDGIGKGSEFTVRVPLNRMHHSA
jgi:two-component system CheB/CheR fusion protein